MMQVCCWNKCYVYSSTQKKFAIYFNEGMDFERDVERMHSKVSYAPLSVCTNDISAAYKQYLRQELCSKTQYFVSFFSEKYSKWTPSPWPILGH